MTVAELVGILADCPPLNDVWVQTKPTAITKVEKVEVNRDLGIVELKWKER